MPGNPVVEFAPSPAADRLVAALAELTASARARFVLVGGLAVAARLETFHRATQDLDAVVGEGRTRFEAGAIEAVSHAHLVNGHLTVGDVPIDVIDIDPQTSFEAIAALDDPRDRLFTSAHLFAFTDADRVELRSGVHRCVAEVARARTLLVAKLSAYLSPRRDTRKRPSDAVDFLALARLLAQQAPPVYGPEVPTVVIACGRWGVEQIAESPGEVVRRALVAGVSVGQREVEALLSVLLDDVLLAAAMDDELPELLHLEPGQESPSATLERLRRDER